MKRNNTEIQKINTSVVLLSKFLCKFQRQSNHLLELTLYKFDVAFSVIELNAFNMQQLIHTGGNLGNNSSNMK